MNPNKQKYNSFHNPQLPLVRQQGFVLILVLVLLATLTLIGVSSMNSSNMELKATANARQHHVAFNAVQSLIEYTVSGQTAVTVDFQTVPSTTQTVTLSSGDATALGASALTADVAYAGCAASVGSSLEEGKGFSSNFFNVIATGANASGASTSTQVQGVRFPAAACN